MSDQRRAILRMLDVAEDHPSVEEIYQSAIQYDRRLSIATVYRTINILADAGLLARIELGDGKARYEEYRGEHHEHLVDVDTGKMVELSDPGIQELLRQIAERWGYRLVDYRLELFGEASSRPVARRPDGLVVPSGAPRSDVLGEPIHLRCRDEHQTAEVEGGAGPVEGNARRRA